MRKNPRRILSPQRLPFRHPGMLPAKRVAHLASGESMLDWCREDTAQARAVVSTANLLGLSLHDYTLVGSPRRDRVGPQRLTGCTAPRYRKQQILQAEAAQMQPGITISHYRRLHEIDFVGRFRGKSSTQGQFL